MTRFDVLKAFNVVKAVSVQHAPAIWMGLGIGCMVMATVSAINDTPKALRKIDEKKRELFDSMDPKDIPNNAIPEQLKLTKKEIVQTVWKNYIRTAAFMGLGITCLISSHHTSAKRNAALLGLYEVSQRQLKSLQDATVKVVGNEKAEEIQQEVDRAKFEPVVLNNLKPIETGYGDSLFYDEMGDRYFLSDLATIRMQLCEITEQMQSGYDDYPCLNQVYAAMGLPPTKTGELFGWDVNTARRIVMDRPRSGVREEDGKAYVIIDFKYKPNRDYLNYR